MREFKPLEQSELTLESGFLLSHIPTKAKTLKFIIKQTYERQCRHKKGDRCLSTEC